MRLTRRQVLKYVFYAVVVGVGVALVASDYSQISASFDQLGDVEWPWVVAAGLAELGAYVAAGQSLRVLLTRAHRPSVVGVTRISLAGQAVANCLPGGPATAGVVMVRQLKRRGVPERESLAAILTLTLLQAIALPVLAIVGAQAPGADEAIPGVQTLALVFISVVAFFVVLGLLLHQRGTLLQVLRWLRDHLPHRLVGMVENYLPSPAQADAEGNVPSSGPRDRITLARATTLATLYWLFDALCLGLAFPAVGAPVPWRALLLSYCAAQLATTLPITPGGLGVVEGSLTVALVAFGDADDKVLAAVLLYRLISYPGLIVVGLLAGITRKKNRVADEPVDEPVAVAA